MPTEFYQDGATAYRSALAAALNDRVEVAWTGVGVVPRTITGGELSAAREAFGHPLVTMDNYPVNDYAQDRIFLGPYTGREPAVATGSAALLANAMEQPLASRIPLFTAADYAWNPRDYRPAQSWEAAIDDLAGGDPTARAALRTLAGNAASSLLNREESGYLTPLIDRFWQTRAAALNHGRPGTDEDYAKAARTLRTAFGAMSSAPRASPPTCGPKSARGPSSWSASAPPGRRPWTPAGAGPGRRRRGLGGAAHRAAAAHGARREPGDGRQGRPGAVPGAGDDRGGRLDRGARRRPDPGPRRRPDVTDRALPRVRPLTAVTALTAPGPASGAVSLEAHVPGPAGSGSACCPRPAGRRPAPTGCAPTRSA
ncbi:beta-N-acetylglucosaminidase domain-containing protein [Streptomyces albulus]|nr:beta-N-acetylglucosaminidase domain-containing protein [Streptomyces noursei]